MTVPQMLHLFDGSVRCKWDHAVTPSSDANTFICSRAGDFHFNALLLHYYVWYFFFFLFSEASLQVLMSGTPTNLPHSCYVSSFVVME